jgi:hypothetical protein
MLARMTEPPLPPVTVVGEWQDAANRRDADRLVELSHPDVEVVGPRGAGHGSNLLRDWVGRAGLQVEPHRVYAAGSTVVVEQDAVWHDREGHPTGSARIASIFTVEHGLVTRFARHDSLGDALALTGLTSANEVFRG